MIYTLNIARAVKNVSVNEIKDLNIFEKYYNQTGFSQENKTYYSIKRLKKTDLLLHGNKLIEKITDSHNGKQHYKSFTRRKNRESVKQ